MCVHEKLQRDFLCLSLHLQPSIFILASITGFKDTVSYISFCGAFLLAERKQDAYSMQYSPQEASCLNKVGKKA